MLLRKWQDIVLDGPVKQVVLVLVRGNRGHGHGSLHEVNGMIGEAAIAHFAFLDERLHGGPGLFDGSERVRVVKLVEIDVVALQTAQTGFDFALDARGCEVFSPSSLLVGECAALRKDVAPVALALQGFAYDLLGSSPAIKGGCINPVDAKIERHVDSADSFALILWSPIDAPTGIGADGSGADTYAGNLKSALAESAGFELHVFASKGGKGADKNWGLAARAQGGGMACRAGGWLA